MIIRGFVCMSIWNAIVLGLVQGIAEFLPISSSGHLSIMNNLFDMSTVDNGHIFFDVLLHFGTLSSIFVVYWQDIAQMVREVLGVVNLGPLAGQPQKRYPAARLFLMIIFATIPMLLVVPIKDLIEALFYQNIFIGVMLILTGCTLYVSDRMQQGGKTERNITVLDAVIIGLCQCVAAIPGLSRSGVTITAGIASGLRRDFAVRFSFLMFIPAVLGASILSLADAVKKGINPLSVPAYLIGMVAAMISGIITISIFRRIFDNGKFGGFSYYCWVMGVLSIILSLIF